jgi:hypothetical protein
MLLSLSRPTSLSSSINTSRKAIERSYNSLSRSTRWPLGLLDETRQRLNEEKEDKVRRAREEADELGRELRYTQHLHEKMGRKAIRDLVRGMLIKERTTLEGMMRATRKLKILPVTAPTFTSAPAPDPAPVDELDIEINGASASGPA